MSVICYPLWYFAFHIIGKPIETSTFQVTKGILAGNNQIVVSTSNALWFLLVLFLAEVLFALFIKLSHNNKIVLFCFVAVSAVLGFLDKANPRIWHWNVALTAVVFLYLGNCFMQWYKKSRLMHSQHDASYWLKIILDEIVFVGIGTVSHILNGRISMTANKFGHSPFLFYVTAIAFSLVITLIVIHIPKIRVIEYIGQNTLLYVGLHIPILRIFERAFPDIFLDYKFSIPFAFVLYFGLIPVVMLFKKFFPYVCGKPSELSSKPIFVCKFVLVAWSAFVLCMTVFSRFGVNIYDPLIMALSCAVLILLSAVFVLVTSKFLPVIYLQTKKSRVEMKYVKKSGEI